MSQILVEISPGELLDKITVLEIKLDRIAEKSKRHNIHSELQVLNVARHRSIPDSDAIEGLVVELKGANLKLYDIITEIYRYEKTADFGPEFVELARAVYRENDRRAIAKRKINQLLGSRLIEEKGHL